MTRKGRTGVVTIFWTVHLDESNATAKKYLAVGAADVQDFMA
jgi:hypothetical protein